jgi:hypothetical protein
MMKYDGIDVIVVSFNNAHRFGSVWIPFQWPCRMLLSCSCR